MAGLVQGLGAMFGRGQPDAVVTRGFLGLELTDVEDGVEIKSVLPKSPADDAGLRPSDAIAEFAGKPVGSAADVLKLAATIGEDEEIRLVVSRDGERTQVTAKTGKGF
jgi:S1-C subfamily serine protease